MNHECCPGPTYGINRMTDHGLIPQALERGKAAVAGEPEATTGMNTASESNTPEACAAWLEDGPLGRGAHMGVDDGTVPLCIACGAPFGPSPLGSRWW